jgi:hypothetical protein
LHWAILLFLASVVLTLAVIPASGQYGGKATINGAVSDPTGAVIPGVDVTVTNTSTGLVTKTTTAGNGTYVVPLLQVGTYSITFSHGGFESYTQTNIVLTPDQVATVNVTLQVGQVTQKIEVSANAQMLETGTASLGQTVSEQTTVELPLNGRNPAALVFLSTGVANILMASNAGVNQTYADGNPAATGGSAAGGREGSTYYMLDGLNSMDAATLLAAPMPNPDATQEFQVIQNNFQPQYGFTPGAIVSIVSKSGTNTWHGDAFEFVRNFDMDAGNPFTHKTDLLKRNQFGGSAGGPIVKDKLFIFGNIQRTAESTVGVGSSAEVPNNAQLAGDFSGQLTGNMVGLCGSGSPPSLTFDSGQLFQVSPSNPYGTPTVCPAGSAMAGKTINVKTPYVGNQINPATYSPVTLGFEQGIPPTTATNGLVYFAGVPTIDHTNEFTIRGDYNLSEKHRIFGRVFFNDYTQPGNPALGVPSGGNVLASIRSWDDQYVNVSGGYNYTIAPNLINSFGLGVNFTHSQSFPGSEINGKPFSLESLGSAVTYPSFSIYPPGIDQIGTSGFGFGQNTNSPMYRTNIAISDSLTWTKSKHLFVFGVDILRMSYTDSTDWQASPRITFDGEVSGMPSLGISAPGHDVADYLLGNANWFEQGGGEYTQNDVTNWSGFAQDSIRLKPNFTLNIGVRWEPYLPPTPRNGRIASWQPGQQSTEYPGAPLNLVFPGDKGISASTVYSTLSNIDPRVGISWQPSFLKHTSIRAAAGIFAAMVPNLDYHHIADVAPFSSVFDLYYSSGMGLIPASAPWTNFAPSGGVSPFPNQEPWASLGTRPPASTKFITPFTDSLDFQRNFTNPKTFTWNLSIEQQFTNNLLLTVAYVGNETQHLGLGMEQNPGHWVTTTEDVRPNPNFNEVLVDSSNGTSSYNSLQISLNKRISHGLQFTSSFTWSKCLDNASLIPTFYGEIGDPYDIGWARGVCAENFPIIWTSDWIWQEPALHQLGSIGSAILGRWEFNGIYTVQSGVPFSISGGCSGNESGTFIGGDRADLTGQPLDVRQGSKAHWLQQYFNPTAFECNAFGTFGNSPRDMLSGPGQNNFDLGIFKNFAFKERLKLQIRAELFNAFNRIWYGTPNTTPETSTFGQITGLTGAVGETPGSGNAFGTAPRIIQLGAKLYW